ncbi:MAG: hypothetical protein ACOC1F_02375 [Myxococcota bacterium]
MDSRVIEYLRDGRISAERLGDLGLGTVGITLNPHFILDQHGERTGWLAKRLRARQYPDPAATFARFQREHELVSRYFGARSGSESMIPDTAFVVLHRNLDDHPDYEPNREYVMVQRFVRGISLEQAARSHGGERWLQARLHAFVEAYQRMQREAHAVLDCFSIRSDHIKVDVRGRRLLLIDTNNPVIIAEELANNSVFCTRFDGDAAGATPDDVHDVFDALCAAGEYEPNELVCSRDREFLREACALEHLARYFPRGGRPNKYLREVLQLFGIASS